jgi:hypothetical protein
MAINIKAEKSKGSKLIRSKGLIFINFCIEAVEVLLRLA